MTVYKTMYRNLGVVMAKTLGLRRNKNLAGCLYGETPQACRICLLDDISGTFCWDAGVAVMMAILVGVLVYIGIVWMGHMIGGDNLRLDLYRAEWIMLKIHKRLHLPDVGGPRS